MRKILKISSLLSFLFIASLLSGCNKKLDFRNAEISDGKIYSKGDNSGYTGKITNIPFRLLPNSRDKMLPLTRLIDVTNGGYNFSNIIAGRSPEEISLFCDVNVAEGILDDLAQCKVSGSDSIVLEFSYKKNSIEGAVIFYSLDNPKKKIGEANYVNDRFDGLETVYSVNTGKKVHQANWKAGIASGKENKFDESTGTTIFDANIVNGVYDGEMLNYSSDGKLITKRIWKNGLLQSNALQNESQNIDACIDLWLKAYRIEKGPDAPASTDQLEEWNGWCQNGKKPGSL